MVQMRQVSSLALVLSSLFLSHAINGLNLADREGALKLGPRDGGPPEAALFPMKQSSGSDIGRMPLSGRDLVASWLGKRDCVDPGYVKCACKWPTLIAKSCLISSSII